MRSWNRSHILCWIVFTKPDQIRGKALWSGPTFLKLSIFQNICLNKGVRAYLSVKYVSILFLLGIVFFQILVKCIPTHSVFHGIYVASFYNKTSSRRIHLHQLVVKWLSIKSVICWIPRLLTTQIIFRLYLIVLLSYKFEQLVPLIENYSAYNFLFIQFNWWTNLYTSTENISYHWLCKSKMTMFVLPPIP